MFKRIIKFFFETTNSSVGTPNFSELLNKELQSLYYQYYWQGTGKRVFYIFLLFIFAYSVFSKKKVARLVARCFILITFLLWKAEEPIKIGNTYFQQNIIGTVVPHISTGVYFVVFLILTLLSYLFFRTFLKKNVTRNVTLFTDIGCCILFILFFMPFWTGELWLF